MAVQDYKKKSLSSLLKQKKQAAQHNCNKSIVRARKSYRTRVVD